MLLNPVVGVVDGVVVVLVVVEVVVVVAAVVVRELEEAEELLDAERLDPEELEAGVVDPPEGFVPI